MKAFYHDESQNPETEIDNLRDEQRPFFKKPVPADDKLLIVEGILFVDPALGLRGQAGKFISSRKWTTQSITFNDESSEGDSRYLGMPIWRAKFCLGLDHVFKIQEDWFVDVKAIVEFVQAVVLSSREKFFISYLHCSYRRASKIIGRIDYDPDKKVDLMEMRCVLELLMKQKISWWRRLLGL